MRTFDFKMTAAQAVTLRIAVRHRLQALGIVMTDETPRAFGSLEGIGKWYAEHSHMDAMIRLDTRLTRLIMGHQQFNAEIAYTKNPNGG